MKALDSVEFGCFLVVYVFHNTCIDNEIDRIHENTFLITFDGKISLFPDL